MPDAKQSYRPRYNYRHPVPRRARIECLQRSDHTCQGCGLEPATEAHHWTYPPEEKTTANHMTGFCKFCHDLVDWFTWFSSFGGSRELLCELFPAFLARLLECPERPEHRRVGRARRVGNAWGAVVCGGSRPITGEVVAVLLRCSGEWRDFVVTGVVDGRPGSWQVLTRHLSKHDEVRPLCIGDLGRRVDRR
ncbi:MAG: hypothetical protein F4137_20685 [Acidobacteria bacterium]|nr:hypothetical protein [Acidobacteriota bacterium]